ncbi:hypothetical protein AA313_de0201477 [Arthrobotrys entomopaga]|nr:hypothetical protein AA313_de0201477 [Arthrobotrys entomopaga]
MASAARNRKPTRASELRIPVGDGPPPTVASRQDAQNTIYWLKKPLFFGICLFVASFWLLKHCGWVCRDRENNSTNQPHVELPGRYLEKYTQIYGKYGLTEPTIIPEDLDIPSLKERLQQETPIVEYYGLTNQFVVPTGFEQKWATKFENFDENDVEGYSQKLRESLEGSILVENEIDINGQYAAFFEAYGTLFNKDRLSPLSIAKVHAALYLGNEPEDKNNIPGNFRLVHAFIGDSITANIFEIESALEKISEYFTEKCMPLEDHSLEYASCVLHFYRCYERIHPFTDGNGRTGRAWVNAMLVYKLLPPLYFKQEWLDAPSTYHALFNDGNNDRYLREHLESILANK